MNECPGFDALDLATLVAEREVSRAMMAQDSFGGASWMDG